MGAFRKLMGYDDKKVEKKPNKNTRAIDRMQFADQTNITDFTLLADKVIYGYPLLINLENVSREESNRILSFLSGVVYAQRGKQIHVKEKIYMIASAEALEDHSIEEFVIKSRN